MCVCTYVNVRNGERKVRGVSYLLLPSEFGGWSPVHHTAEEPLPAEPCCQPHSHFIAKSSRLNGAIHQYRALDQEGAEAALGSLSMPAPSSSPASYKQPQLTFRSSYSLLISF